MNRNYRTLFRELHATHGSDAIQIALERFPQFKEERGNVRSVEVEVNTASTDPEGLIADNDGRYWYVTLTRPGGGSDTYKVPLAGIGGFYDTLVAALPKS